MWLQVKELMMELLLARGGGKGLFEGTFLFGTASVDEDVDGDNPTTDDLEADFELFVGPLSRFLGIELVKTHEINFLSTTKYLFIMLTFGNIYNSK